MHHTRDEVIQRTIEEFKMLDDLVAGLSAADWAKPLRRPETKDPWMVKDALAHITHWKAELVRLLRRQRRPPEERGLSETDANHLIYMRWRDRDPEEVLAWHRQVQEDLLAALSAAPEAWFRRRERKPDWPSDLDGHSAYHRVKDIKRALRGRDK
jgi:hypothetical protein